MTPLGSEKNITAFLKAFSEAGIWAGRVVVHYGQETSALIARIVVRMAETLREHEQASIQDFLNRCFRKR